MPGSGDHSALRWPRNALNVAPTDLSLPTADIRSVTLSTTAAGAAFPKTLVAIAAINLCINGAKLNRYAIAATLEAPVSPKWLEFSLAMCLAMRSTKNRVQQFLS